MATVPWLPKIRFVEHESAALKNNPAGDPHVRTVGVYLPPSYDKSSIRMPVVYCLSGFTGSSLTWFNFQPWGLRIDQRIDRLIESGMSEMILVFPDCFTKYGGSQYLDSAALGRYSTYITGELVPFIDREFRTVADRRYRGVTGKSSGGYGAIRMGFDASDIFSAVAAHSADMYFEYCYLRDFPAAYRQLKKQGGLDSFLQNFQKNREKGKLDHELMNTIAMSCCYSSSAGLPYPHFELPFDEISGEIRPDVWDRWKQHDPVILADHKKDSLRSLGMLYLECGSRDEFFLDIGNRIFSAKLRAAGIPHEYQEFDDGHFNTNYRYEVSLPKFAEYFASL